MTTVAMFTDYACPWCYLGRARLKAAVEGRDAAIRVIHFPLASDVPEGGRAIRPYLESRGMDADAMVGRLALLMEAEGLPYLADPDRMFGFNTRRAQELAVWAEGQPGGDAIHDALFRACHVDHVDVSSVDVLVGIVQELGLDAKAARAALVSGASGAEVDRHWALGGEIGVRSVPTFVVGGQGVVGAQPVEALVGLLEGAGAA